MSATSSATCAGSSTTRICGPTSATSTRWPGIAETVDLDHIKHHYYESHRHINPTGIVPEGPVIDFAEPVTRALAAA